jgi:hypothetical protein
MDPKRRIIPKKLIVSIPVITTSITRVFNKQASCSNISPNYWHIADWYGSNGFWYNSHLILKFGFIGYSFEF